MLVVKVEEWPDGDQSKAEVLAVASAELVEVIDHPAVETSDGDKGCPAYSEAVYEFRAARRNKPERRWSGVMGGRDTDWFTPITRALGGCRRRQSGGRRG